MHITLMTVHIAAGALGLLTGFVALYASKGATLHRGSGKWFVYSMVTMAMLGAFIAAAWSRAAAVNVPAGLLTTYLVITGVLTVARTRPAPRWIDVGLLLVALGVSASMLSLAARTIGRGRITPFIVPMIIFATIGLLGAAGDLRILRSRPLEGGRRLARHLWRMSAALAIATLSFSVRLPRILPAPLRTPIVYALPTLAVLATMAYWLWRVRTKRPSRSAVLTDLASRAA